MPDCKAMPYSIFARNERASPGDCNMETVTDWIIAPMIGFTTGRPVGFSVHRIHAPYTDTARVEHLNKGRVYRTESDARAAIAEATGDA